MDVGPRLHFGGVDMGGGVVGFGVIEGACVKMRLAGEAGGAIGQRRAATEAEEPFGAGGRGVDGGGALGPAPCPIPEAEEGGEGRAGGAAAAFAMAVHLPERRGG